MNNVHGILLVTGAMAAFTLEDMFIKQLTGSQSVAQIMITIGTGSALCFAAMVWLGRDSLLVRSAWSRVALIRMAAEAISAYAFFTALALVPLSTVAAVFQATPLAITMGAALFFGEQVGWRRWSAIVLGFLGVLLIIRPGLEGFQPAALLVLISVIGIAARDLLTRMIATNVPSTVVSFQGFFSLIVAGSLLLVAGSAPLAPVGTTEAGLFAGGIVCGVAGYYGIVRAMRVGDASAVTPFRYTRLIFSIIAGMLVFGERPDLMTLIGAALVIGTGLYTFLRERRLARMAAV